jgi:MFS family permease
MKNPYANISPAVWLLALISLVNKAGTMVFIFFPIYLTQGLKFDLSIAGQILTVLGLGTVLGSSFGGMLTDRLGFLVVQSSGLFFAGTLPKYTNDYGSHFFNWSDVSVDASSYRSDGGKIHHARSSATSLFVYVSSL